MGSFAIIPARMGSKRIPGKNSKILGGKPLAKWTIDCAFDSKAFEKVIFSTDDALLVEVARDHGCIVPGLRSKNLSEDTSDLVSVCLDLIANKDLNIKLDDILILLQPTSPFRNPETVKKAIHMISYEETDSVVGFSQTKINPQWLHLIDAQGYIHSNIENSNFKNQTSSTIYYIPNGLIYAIRVSTLIQGNSFYTRKTIPLICTDPIEAIDIDEPADWDFAEYCLKRRNLKS